MSTLEDALRERMHDRDEAAFLDTETFQPRATREITTFPFMGEEMLGFSGDEHADFRRVVLAPGGWAIWPRDVEVGTAPGSETALTRSRARFIFL